MSAGACKAIPGICHSQEHAGCKQRRHNDNEWASRQHQLLFKTPWTDRDLSQESTCGKEEDKKMRRIQWPTAVWQMNLASTNLQPARKGSSQKDKEGKNRTGDKGQWAELGNKT